MEPKIKWPKGKNVNVYLDSVKKLRTEILTQRVVAIDPGSRNVGYAIFEAGKMVDSGTIVTSNSEIQQRLAEVHKRLPKSPVPSVMVIEDVARGTMSHLYLKLAVGAIVSAYPHSALIWMPICVWKAYAKGMNVQGKNDELDAQLIGLSLVAMATELAP